MCGENADWKRQQCRPSRAIPACAGRTPHFGISTALRTGPSPRVRGELCCSPTPHGYRPGHPRVCGENTYHLLTNDNDKTGHPRVCGENAVASASGSTLTRAIPACAGRTGALLLNPCTPYGPSPRVRGERGTARTAGAGSRAIPACAGRTATTGGPMTRSSGHPRVCGEN